MLNDEIIEFNLTIQKELRETITIDQQYLFDAQIIKELENEQKITQTVQTDIRIV